MEIVNVWNGTRVQDKNLADKKTTTKKTEYIWATTKGR